MSVEKFELVGQVDVYRTDDLTLATRRDNRGFGIIALGSGTKVYVYPRRAKRGTLVYKQTIDLSNVR